MSDQTVIQVQDLTKYYGTTLGVKDLSMTVEAGEIFGFLGPNGAGKTTTIRLLLDLLRPSAGKVNLFGKPIRQNTVEIRRRCGYLPGNFAAYGHMTGAQFLRFTGNLRRVNDALPHDLLDRFKLSAKELAQRIKHLSHGNHQKIGIIQAFFHQPELLILDEPTSGLDPLMQEAFYDLLRQSQQRGATIFFSSHNLPEVEKVCDRVAIIRQGELVALESLANLKKKRYRRLRVTLSEPIQDIALPNTELVRNQDHELEFLVKGEIGPVLAGLTDLPIADIVFPEPDLEEVFMAYYQKDEHD